MSLVLELRQPVPEESHKSLGPQLKQPELEETRTSLVPELKQPEPEESRTSLVPELKQPEPEESRMSLELEMRQPIHRLIEKTIRIRSYRKSRVIRLNFHQNIGDTRRRVDRLDLRIPPWTKK